jgi:CO/xanthine dehydrogenase Mo-binding subunit
MDSTSFIQDIYPDNTLHAVTIRSPVAKGRLKSIDFPRLPYNYFIIRAADIPGKNSLYETDMPILAFDSLSYFGEPLALVIGHGKAWLEEYARQCKVIAEEEEPVFSNCNEQDEIVLDKREIKIGGNIGKAAKTIQSEYFTGMQDRFHCETVGAVSWYKKDRGLLIVQMPAKWPQHVINSVTGVLGIAHSSVSVRATRIGFDIDSKDWYTSLLACHAALGTYITKKPVRLVPGKEEEFLYSPKRPETRISISSSFDDKDNIIGTEINAAVNLGAYGVNTKEFLDQICFGCLGIYNLGSIKLDAKAIKTNNPPAGPYSGFGLSQGLFAHQRHISKIAEQINQDPVEWRINHFNKTGEYAHNPKNGEQMLAAVASMSDYYRRWASYELLRKKRVKFTLKENSEGYRGIGIALGCYGNDNLMDSDAHIQYWAASVVEVAIDPVEYFPKIRGVWMCIDGGKIFSLEHAKEILNVNAIQAIGWSYEEKINYTNGMLVRDDFENYTIPDPCDIPPINIAFLNGELSKSPKHRNICSEVCRELPFNCIPAAYLQAVSQAMDHHFCSVPIKKEEILEASKPKKSEKIS